MSLNIRSKSASEGIDGSELGWILPRRHGRACCMISAKAVSPERRARTPSLALVHQSLGEVMAVVNGVASHLITMCRRSADRHPGQRRRCHQRVASRRAFLNMAIHLNLVDDLEQIALSSGRRKGFWRCSGRKLRVAGRTRTADYG